MKIIVTCSNDIENILFYRRCRNPPDVNSCKNNDFLMFLPFRESGRIPDPALPRDCSKGLRRHPRRLGSETLPLLQRWGLGRLINHITTGSLRMVLYTKELHLFIYEEWAGGGAEFPMTARVTEQPRLRELSPAGSLASPPSVTRKRTRYIDSSCG